jgi:hypothetical protein
MQKYRLQFSKLLPLSLGRKPEKKVLSNEEVEDAMQGRTERSFNDIFGIGAFRKLQDAAATLKLPTSVVHWRR